MSTQTASVGTCRYCDGDRQIPSEWDECCSKRCYYQKRGEKAVNCLRNDHRLCATCGSWIKEVTRPTDKWAREQASALEVALDNGAEYHNIDGIGMALDATEAASTRPTTTDAICGFQHRTENAESVEKEFQIDEYRSIFGTGLGCKCGITNTRDVDETLRSVEEASVLANYVVVFRALEREGQLDQRISKKVFFNTYKETSDIEFSLGKALHG